MYDDSNSVVPPASKWATNPLYCAYAGSDPNGVTWGNGLEFVYPASHTLPAESTSIESTWSKQAPPNKVDERMDVPLGSSRVTKTLSIRVKTIVPKNPV